MIAANNATYTHIQSGLVRYLKTTDNSETNKIMWLSNQKTTLRLWTQPRQYLAKHAWQSSKWFSTIWIKYGQYNGEQFYLDHALQLSTLLTSEQRWSTWQYYIGVKSTTQVQVWFLNGKSQNLMDSFVFFADDVGPEEKFRRTITCWSNFYCWAVRQCVIGTFHFCRFFLLRVDRHVARMLQCNDINIQ